jgi:MFS family permease
MALPLLAPSLPLLFAAALLFGIFNGGLDVAMNAQATDVERARKRPTMSSFHGFWSLGGLVGASIGGILIAMGFGNGSGMTAAAILFALIVAGIWNWVRPLPDVEQQAAGPHFMLPRGPALILGGLAMMVMVVEGASADWSALHLVQNTGATPATAAAGFAAFSLAMASCRFVGDAVTERFGRVMVLRVGGILIASGFIVAVLVPIPAIAAAGFGLIGLGAANIVPVLMGEASRLPGMAPGAGVAAVATIGYLGFLAGPPLIGLLAGAIGLAGALAVMTLAGVVLVLAAGMVTARN